MKSYLPLALIALCLNSGSSVSASPAEQKQRVLRFPPDRSLGSLFTRPERKDGFEVPGGQYKDWQRLGEARGAVALPERVEVRLNVSAAGSRDLSGLDALSPDALDAMWLANTELTDDGLKHVGRLTGLKYLDLGQTRVTDAGIQHLGGLKELRQIDLDAIGVEHEGFGIGNDGLAVLATLPSLWRLKIRYSQVTDAGMIHLKNMSSLRSLDMESTKVSDRGLSLLKRLPQLESLDLGGPDAPITDAASVHVGKLKSLRSLTLRGRNFSDAALVHVAKLAHLEYLTLEDTAITNEGLRHLAPLSSLKWIRFRQITDGGAAHLAKLKSLATITGDLELTDDGVIALARLPQLEKMNLDGDGTRITDVCLPAIAAMKSLKELTFFDCLITDQGLQQLAGMPSLTEVSFYRNEKITTDGLKFLESLPALNRLSIHFAKSAHADGDNRPHLRPLRQLTGLKILHLSGHGLTNDDLGDLATLISLEHLDVKGDLVVNNDGIRHLAGLTSLKHLAFGETAVTDDGLKHLAEMSKLESLMISGTFTDRGLEQFLKLTSLRNLQIASPSITEKAIEQLKKRHPSVQLVEHFEYRCDGLPACYRSGDTVLRMGTSKDRRDADALEGRDSPPLLVDHWLNAPVETQSLEQLQGQVVLIHFWHARTIRNGSELPRIRKLLKQYEERGLVVVGIHISLNEEEMERFVRTTGIDWPVATDIEDRTATLFHEDSTGTFYLVDRSGKLRFARPHPADLEKAVKLLVNEK